MDKKAQIVGRKMIFYVIFSIMLTVVGLIIIYFSVSSVSDIAHIPAGLEEYILESRFLTSPSCFAYVDKETLRVQAFVIDLDKFTNKTLASCYETDIKIGFRLTLSYEDQKTMIETPLKKGASSGRTYDVLVVSQGKFSKGELVIEK